MQSRNLPYLPAVDHLRAFAAILIIFYHGQQLITAAAYARHGLPRPEWLFSGNPFATLINEGHTAVALFMVLSGFIFTYGARGRAVAYWPFLKNRLLRIYPLYFCLLAVEIYALPQSFTLTGLQQSLLCLPNLPGDLVHTFVGGGWAIAVEFQFYLLFPFLERFFHERGIRWLLGLLGCALLARLLSMAHGANIRDLSYWTIVGRIDQFLLGMLIARIYVRERDRPRRWRILLLPAIALVVASLWWLNGHGGWPLVAWWKALWPTWEGACWGLVLLGYLAFAATLPGWLATALSRLGELSFSLYLTHGIVISVLLPRHWVLASRPDSWTSAFLSTLVIVLPATIAISLLTYHIIERPFLELRVRYLVERPAAGSREAAADRSEGQPARRTAA